MDTTLTPTALYSRPQAAAFLNITVAAVQRLINAGELDAIQIGMQTKVYGRSIAQLCKIELPYVPERKPLLPETQKQMMAEFRRRWAAKPKAAISGGSHIAELLIPADAKRINTPTGRKCRVSAARVVGFTTLEGEPAIGKEFFSGHDTSFVYREGDLVEPKDPFDDDVRVECASGIHCFITRREAVEY